jgi:hypothetical protein
LTCRVGVISEPEVFSHTLTEKDAFIILASDGVWEFIDSQAAVTIIGNAATAEEGCRQVHLTVLKSGTQSSNWTSPQTDGYLRRLTRCHTYWVRTSPFRDGFAWIRRCPIQGLSILLSLCGPHIGQLLEATGVPGSGGYPI